MYRTDTIDLLTLRVSGLRSLSPVLVSVAMVLALHYVKEGKKGLGSFWIWSVVVLGAIFMGFQVVEFTEFALHGLTPRTNLFGTTFFILTGLHGGHVTIGVIWLIFMGVAHKKNALRSDNAEDLELAGLYWHFVDIVWIVIFTVIYLISASDGAPVTVPHLGH